MFIQRKCLLLVCSFGCAATLFFGCTNKSYSNPEGYQVQKPQLIELDKALMEISGIHYFEPRGTLVGISDSKRNIFELNYRQPKLTDLTDKILPKDNDNEDIVVVGNNLYVLSSPGVIFEVPVKNADSTNVVAYSIQLDGTNDFETLYYDKASNGLVMLCKSCAHEEGVQKRTAFRFDLQTKTFDSVAYYTINVEDVRALVKDNNVKFNPSAAAIHPVNKNLYIVASADNMLVITDPKGKVLEAYQMNPDVYPQAEGIAFAPNGDMFISNEGKFGKPTLIFLPYKPSTKK